VTVSGFLIQIGLTLFKPSYSVETSLIFFFLLSFLASFSSLISVSSSPSFFSSFLSSSPASSSETSFSVVFSTNNSIGNEMNSECFLTKSLILLYSKNSKLSDFKCKIIFVPLVN